MGTLRLTTYTEVVIEKSARSWLIECRHCRGTGQKYPGYGGKHKKRKYECPTCGGSGVNKVDVPPDESIFECRHCRATGQKYPGYGGKDKKRKYECPSCAGLGIQILTSDRVECNHCEGTGQKYPKYGGKDKKRKYTCPTCNGTGSNQIDSI